MALEKVGSRYIHYGPQNTDQSRGAEVAGTGATKEVEYVFSYDGLPAAESGNEMQVKIPANAVIKSAMLQVLEAAAGTDGSSTNPFLLVGLAQEDGTAIDADGLVSVAALTDIDGVGKVVADNGALVGTTIGASDGVVVASVDGASSLTAGKFKLVVEYAPLA